MILTPEEDNRLIELEDKNCRHQCSDQELVELQTLIDKLYDQNFTA